MSDSKTKSSCRIKAGETYPGKDMFIKVFDTWLKNNFSPAAIKVLMEQLPKIRKQPNGALHPGDVKYEKENQAEDEHERIMKSIKARRETGLEEELVNMSTFSVLPDTVRKSKTSVKMLSPSPKRAQLKTAIEEEESKEATVAPTFEPQEYEELEGPTSKDLLDQLKKKAMKKKELGGNAASAEETFEALIESFDGDKDGDWFTTKVRSDDGTYEDTDEGRELKVRDMRLVAAMDKAQRKLKRWKDALIEVQEEYDLLKVELEIRRQAENEHREEYEKAQDLRLKEHEELYKDVPQVQGTEVGYDTPVKQGSKPAQQPGGASGATPVYQMPADELSAKDAAYGEGYINTLVNGNLPETTFWRLSSKAYWDVKTRIGIDFYTDGEEFFKDSFGSLWDRFHPNQGRELFAMIVDHHFREDPDRAHKEATKYREMKWDDNEKGYRRVSEALAAKAKQSNVHLRFASSGEPLHSEENIREFFQTRLPVRLRPVLDRVQDWEDENGFLPIASIKPSDDTWIRRLTKFQLRHERRSPPDPNFVPPAEGLTRIREIDSNGRMTFKDVPIKNKAKAAPKAAPSANAVEAKPDLSNPEGKCTHHVGEKHLLKDCNRFKSGATTYANGWGPNGKIPRGNNPGRGQPGRGNKGKGRGQGQGRGGATQRQQQQQQQEFGPKKVSSGYDVNLWCSADESRFVRRMGIGFRCFRCGVPLASADSWRTHKCKDEAAVKAWMDPLRKAVLEDKPPKAFVREQNLTAAAAGVQQPAPQSSSPAEAKEANSVDDFRKQIKEMIRQEMKTDTGATGAMSNIDRYNSGIAADDEAKRATIKRMMKAMSPVSPQPPPHLSDAVPRVPCEESLARSEQQPCVRRGPALLCAHKCAAGLASTGAILLKLRVCPWGPASLNCAKQLALE